MKSMKRIGEKAVTEKDPEIIKKHWHLYKSVIKFLKDTGVKMKTEVVTKKRHDHVLRDIRSMQEQVKDATIFGGIYFK